MTTGIAFMLGVLTGISAALVWLAIGLVIMGLLPSVSASVHILQGLREPTWKTTVKPEEGTRAGNEAKP